MSRTRRVFLADVVKAGIAVAGTAALPLPLFAAEARRTAPADAKGLAWRAVEAARAAGASYADARLTHTRNRDFMPAVLEVEEQTVGVRALVDGYWGFAASPYWTPDEMARLGREAVSQAKTNAVGKTRRVELGTVPVVRDGRWVMPVEQDPFEVPVEEVLDYMASLRMFVDAVPGAKLPLVRFFFRRQERAFASTEGSSFTQRLYRTSGQVGVAYGRDGRSGQRDADFFDAAGRGWEHLRGGERRLREWVPQAIAEIEADWALPAKPVEVGRYDVVFDARSMAVLLAQTLGPATQLDRALGYEANAGGTSYLNDPLEMLGTYQAGSPVVGVTANRSEAGGLATVKWDDEGVEPAEFTLLEDGVLVDFQTTRESAAWLAEAYARQSRPVRSHGCAAAPEAFDAPLLHTPNLVMTPGQENLALDDLVAGTKKGIAVTGARIWMDYQRLNGLGDGTAIYEIRDGKRVAVLRGAGYLFRAPELWRNVIAVGGPGGLEWRPVQSTKGEPAQTTEHTVTAVPAAVKQLTVIDTLRKA